MSGAAISNDTMIDPALPIADNLIAAIPIRQAAWNDPAAPQVRGFEKIGKYLKAVPRFGL